MVPGTAENMGSASSPASRTQSAYNDADSQDPKRHQSVRAMDVACIGVYSDGHDGYLFGWCVRGAGEDGRRGRQGRNDLNADNQVRSAVEQGAGAKRDLSVMRLRQ